MKETVLPHALENKLGAILQRVEDHLRYGTNNTRTRLEQVVNDPEVQRYLDTLRVAGRLPSPAFESVDPNKLR